MGEWIIGGWKFNREEGERVCEVEVTGRRSNACGCRFDLTTLVGGEGPHILHDMFKVVSARNGKCAHHTTAWDTMRTSKNTAELNARGTASAEKERTNRRAKKAKRKRNERHQCA